MDDLVRAGKVRYTGTSNFTVWQIVEALWAAKEWGLVRPVSSQPAYNFLDRRVERELLPMARTYGIAVIPWSPLAQGFLAGKYSRDESAPGEARLQLGEKGIAGYHFTEAAFDVIEAMEPIVQEKGCTMSQLALAWCISQPGLTSAIVGPRTLAQLKDNLGALELSLSEADQARLDEIVPPGHMVVPYQRARTEPRTRWV